MYARSIKIQHPLGIQIETPLLIPSFSSKGFSFNKEGISEVSGALKITKEFLTECLLISAYDMFHKHIEFDEKDICTEITVIDSGGYETSGVYDFSSTTKHSYPIKSWNIENLTSVIERWPEYKAAIIVSYDHGTERNSLEEQIIAAKNLFQRFPKFLHSFLIKPETETQSYIQMDNLLLHVQDLSAFKIIGVTEKELGNSILKRMEHIAKIRLALNKEKNEAPIHIFGSLDPITSILYFLAGAEIFDGLTWLKYSYHEGTAIYPSNYGAIHSDLGIHLHDRLIRTKSIVNNIYNLSKMKYIMKDYLASNNFEVFNKLGLQGNFGAYLERQYNTLMTTMR